MSSFAQGEGPSKAKMNQKAAVVSATQPASTGDDADVRVWLDISVAGKPKLKVRESATGTFVQVGGAAGLVDYPNFSWKEARDHFERTSLEPASALDIYRFDGVGSATIYSAAQNEFYSHAVTNGIITTGNGSALVAYQFTVSHTKNDKDSSFTKAVIEFRVRTGIRATSLRLSCGLAEPNLALTANPVGVVTDKVIVAVDGTGNWFGRVANGTTESTLDLGVSADNTNYKFRLEWTSTQVEFFKDGISQGTITTNLPDIPLAVVPLWSRNDTGVDDGANDLIIDYWHYKAD